MRRLCVLLLAVVGTVGCDSAHLISEPVPPEPVWNVRVVPDSAVFHLRAEQVPPNGQLFWFATVGATITNDGPTPIYVDPGCSSTTGMNALYVTRTSDDPTSSALTPTPVCALVLSDDPKSEGMTYAKMPARIAIPTGGSHHVSTDVRSFNVTSATSNGLVTGNFQLTVDLRSSDGSKRTTGYNLLAPDAMRTSLRFQLALP